MPEASPPRVLVLACGALAREIRDVSAANGWDHVDLECLPATLHNTPQDIPGAVDHRLTVAKDNYDRIMVGYADCGTGGLLEPIVTRHGAEMLPGAHCYEFFAGHALFAQLHEAELGTFYLTDFLVKHFDRMVWKNLGLDRHPELRDLYFGNYRRVVYIAQTEDRELQAMARSHADFLGLKYHYRPSGDGPLSLALAPALAREETCRS